MNISDSNKEIEIFKKVINGEDISVIKNHYGITEQNLESLIQKTLNNISNTKDLSTVLEKTGIIQPQIKVKLTQKGKEAITQQKISRAFGIKSAPVNKKDYLEWVIRALTLMKEQRFQEAIDAFEKASLSDPYDFNLNLQKAKCYELLNKNNLAIDEYDKALDLEPMEFGIWNNKGVNFSILGRNEEAIECFDFSLILNPENADTWNNKGNILIRLRQNDEAIYHFEQTIKYNPKIVNALVNLSGLYSIKRDYKNALENVNKVLEINPNNILALNNKSSILAEEGNYKNALPLLDKILELKEDYAMAWYNKGCIYHEMKDYKNALDSFKRSTEIDSNDYQALTNIGALLIDINILNIKESLKYFEQALHINPEDHVANYNKAKILHILNNFPEAIRYYRTSLEKYHNLSIFTFDNKIEKEMNMAIERIKLDRLTLEKHVLHPPLILASH